MFKRYVACGASSFIVRVDLSTSGTCVFLATTLMILGSRLLQAHSNSFSADMVIIWKPRDIYMLIVRWRPWIMVWFVLFLTSLTVGNISFREMVCKNGVPWTKKKSAHSVTSWCISLMVYVRGVCTRIGTTRVVRRLVLPWKYVVSWP